MSLMISGAVPTGSMVLRIGVGPCLSPAIRPGAAAGGLQLPASRPPGAPHAGGSRALDPPACARPAPVSGRHLVACRGCDRPGRVPHRRGPRPSGDRPPARRLRLGGPGPGRDEPVRRPGRRCAGVPHGPRPRAGRLPALRRRPGCRGGGGQAVGHAPGRRRAPDRRLRAGLPPGLAAPVRPLPFLYESALGTVRSLEFDRPGSQDVEETWTRGEGSGWMQLETLDPSSTRSERATFTITCTSASST